MPESASSSLKQQATNDSSPRDNLQRSRMLVDFKQTTTAMNPQAAHVSTSRVVTDIARNSMWDFPTEK